MMIPDDLAERLRAIAEREHRSPEDALRSVLTYYEAHTQPAVAQNADVQAALLRMRPKLYERARRYWQQTGDAERLKLTDEQLDEQFWLFDEQGVPRLKSDQAAIPVQNDPLVEIAEMALSQGWGSEREDISENFDDALNEIITVPHQSDTNGKPNSR
jgi:plasmid stability protein